MSDWPGWVLPLAIGVGVVVLGILVFLIVYFSRKDKASGDSFDSPPRGKSGAIESELSVPQASDEAKGSSSIADEPEPRTPTVPASQAVGFGWAKASDLAQLTPLEGDD